MKTSKNKVVIEGVLKENKLERKIDKNGKNFITGKLMVETEKDNVIPVSIYIYQLKNDGNINKLYGSIETVLDSYKSVADVGPERADRIKITSGEIAANEFYLADGTFVSGTSFKTVFINRVDKAAKLNPRATFEVDIFIEGVKEEEDKEENFTGRISIAGLVVGYEGRLVPVSFIVPVGAGAKFAENNYERGQTVTLSGSIVNSAIVEKIEKEFDGFGDSIFEEKTHYTRELRVMRGSHAIDAGEEGAFEVSFIKQCKEKRNNALAEMKQKAEDKASQREESNYDSGFEQASKPSADSTGF